MTVSFVFNSGFFSSLTSSIKVKLIIDNININLYKA